MTSEVGRRKQELRRSNAAGKHGDRRTKKLRDRSARERDAKQRSASE